MLKNPNHPPKGSKTKVQPIKKLRDITSIKKILSDEPRNLALYIIGINTALKASDLARLTVGQVRHLKPGDTLEIKWKKPSNGRYPVLNKACVDAIAKLIDDEDLADGDPLFRSQKGGPLTVQTINKLIKGWCRSINLDGNYGSHTLRKTFGFHKCITFNYSLSELARLFGHSSQRVTIEYLCIEPGEMRDIYMDEL